MARRRSQCQRKARRAQRTILFVGEGDGDYVFLKYLKGLYNTRGCGVSADIRNAHGYGPEHVIDVTVRQVGDYGHRATLLDTDIPWTDALKKQARRQNIEMIPSEPCFEGLLMDILGVASSCQTCVCKLYSKSNCWDLKNRAWYEKSTPKYLLDQRANHVTTLQRLIQLLSCPES